MTWGFKNRLNTILPDGRAVMLAIDHGYFLGPIHGLEQPLETVKTYFLIQTSFNARCT